MYVVHIGEYSRQFDNRREATEFVKRIKLFLIAQGGTLPIIYIDVDSKED